MGVPQRPPVASLGPPYFLVPVISSYILPCPGTQPRLPECLEPFTRRLHLHVYTRVMFTHT